MFDYEIIISRVDSKTENKVIDDIQLEKGTVYSYVNPISNLDALKNKEVYTLMDGLFVDGSFMLVAIHFCYGNHITRRSPDMVGYIPEVFDNSSKHNRSICLAGISQQQMEMAIENFSVWYPDIVWKKCRNSYFSVDSSHFIFASIGTS